LRVVDASVIVALVANDLDPDRLGDEELATPHLIDSEVTNALRHLVLRGDPTDDQGSAALEGFMRLALTRYPADWLCNRLWELRHNVSAYDATYVALAEMIGASALLTSDARLAHAPDVLCAVRVIWFVRSVRDDCGVSIEAVIWPPNSWHAFMGCCPRGSAAADPPKDGGRRCHVLAPGDEFAEPLASVLGGSLIAGMYKGQHGTGVDDVPDLDAQFDADRRVDLVGLA